MPAPQGAGAVVEAAAARGPADGTSVAAQAAPPPGPRKVTLGG